MIEGLTAMDTIAMMVAESDFYKNEDNPLDVRLHATGLRVGRLIADVVAHETEEDYEMLCQLIEALEAKVESYED